MIVLAETELERKKGVLAFPPGVNWNNIDGKLPDQS